MQTCLTQNSRGVSGEGTPITSSNLQEAEEVSPAVWPALTRHGTTSTAGDQTFPTQSISKVQKLGLQMHTRGCATSSLEGPRNLSPFTV